MEIPASEVKKGDVIEQTSFDGTERCKVHEIGLDGWKDEQGQWFVFAGEVPETGEPMEFYVNVDSSIDRIEEE